MPDYLPDHDYTAERIMELSTAVELANYELASAVALARALGMPWKPLAEASGLTVQGIRQKLLRYGNKVEPAQLEPAERARIGRLIGVNYKVTRFEVHTVTAGMRGVSAVKTAMLSRHLTKDVAYHHAQRVAKKRGETIEVHQVAPDGERKVLRAFNRPGKARYHQH